MRSAVKIGIAASMLAAPSALYASAWSRLSGLPLGLSIMAAPLLLFGLRA
jgi:hypothetical protein